MEMLWLVPALPLAGFLVLFVTEGKLPKIAVACIGAGCVGFSAVVAAVVGWEYLTSGTDAYSQVMWTWMAVGEFKVEATLYFDYLALVMVGVITGVGFLIHLYATGYMWDEEGYSRFFAYTDRHPLLLPCPTRRPPFVPRSRSRLACRPWRSWSSREQRSPSAFRTAGPRTTIPTTRICVFSGCPSYSIC